MIAGWIILFVAVELSAKPTQSYNNRTNDSPKGIVVSCNTSWNGVKANGTAFAYLKATEGLKYQNRCFAQEYVNSYNAGVIRGGYHLARPDLSPGNVQADYFVSNTASWPPDGFTLPGALDINHNSNGPNECYGLNHTDMIHWIQRFSDRYHARTSRFPVIHTTFDWWYRCTGNSNLLSRDHPLWIPSGEIEQQQLPAGWSFPTFFTSAGDIIFHGDYDHLKIFAKGLNQK